MISVSDDYKTAIANTPANIREKIVFTLLSGDVITVTNANIWQGGLTIEDSVSSDGQFEIGSTHIGQFTVSLTDIAQTVCEDVDFELSSEGHLLMNGTQVTYEDVYANVDFDGATAVLWLAISGQEFIQKGVYTVVRSTHTDGIIDITAYDNMNKFSKLYATSTLSYPATFRQIVQDACTACGVTFNSNSATFDGYSTSVSTKPTDETLTFREVIGYVAQACGYNLRCNTEGKLTFVRYAMSGFASGHQISSLYAFDHSYYPITITGAKIVVTYDTDVTDPDTGEVETTETTAEYTAGTDDYQLVIQDNPFITTDNAQTFANLIYSTFGGVAFYSGSISHSSDFTIEASDVAVVTDRYNNTYNFLISSTVFGTGSAQISDSYAEEPYRKIAVQPTGLDKLNNSVKQALLDAKNSLNRANYATQIAGNTDQYFWHTESGTDTGAHITEIPKEDFLGDPANGGGNLLARSNGIAVRDGLTELATFGANGSVIGKTNDTHLEMDYHSIQGIDREGNTYFHVSDIREDDGNGNLVATVTLHWEVGADEASTYPLYLVPTTMTSVMQNDAETTDYTVDYDNATITFDYAYEHDYFDITFTTSDIKAKAYTLGIRGAGTVAPMSTAEGYGNIASAYTAHAEGLSNEATGVSSHAEGNGNMAVGQNSHVEGESTYASGKNSHAGGLGTKAYGDNQTVIGKYNVRDASGNYAFIVGNGTAETDDQTSNAFAVRWSGVLEAGAVDSFANYVTFGETPLSYHFVASAGLVSINYAGEGKAHSVDDVLFTLPVGYRPTTTVRVPFLKVSGYVGGIVLISTAGVAKVGAIEDTSSTGRIYFNCSFPVV